MRLHKTIALKPTGPHTCSKDRGAGSNLDAKGKKNTLVSYAEGKADEKLYV